jgi:uncharacterized protein
MEDLKTSLLNLQGLDNEIDEARGKLEEFEPQLREVDGPITALDSEITAARTRLEDLRREIRRLETAAEQKRQRLHVYEERMSRIRNLREEAASRVEMDLIRRAADADDSEALGLMEQATRTDLKLDDLEKQMAKARAELAPRREELETARNEAAAQIEVLRDRRHNHALRIEKAALRLYERLRTGKTNMVLAPLTAEGACGHCFNILPLQEQTEVRNADTLRRCEACGVILYAQ